MLSTEHYVAIKALQVNTETAENNKDETVWLLPIHANRILEALTILIEKTGKWS